MSEHRSPPSLVATEVICFLWRYKEYVGHDTFTATGLAADLGFTLDETRRALALLVRERRLTKLGAHEYRLTKLRRLPRGVRRTLVVNSNGTASFHASGPLTRRSGGHWESSEALSPDDHVDDIAVKDWPPGGMQPAHRRERLDLVEGVL